MYIENRNNNHCLLRNTIVGVTSFGDGCGDPNYPGVYARITEVKSWIEEVVTETQDSNCKYIMYCIHNTIRLSLIKLYV